MRTINSASRGAYSASVTLNNSDWSKTLDIRPGAGMYNSAVGDANSYCSSTGEAFFDVTSTTDCKVRFAVLQNDDSNQTVGISTGTVFASTVMFIKLADT